VERNVVVRGELNKNSQQNRASVRKLVNIKANELVIDSIDS